MRLKDKVAIVTGAASGIGAATAMLFAEEGARVVVADVQAEAGEKIVSQIKDKGGEALFVKTDVSKEEDARRVSDSAVQTFGKLDILVNNAAAFGKLDILVNNAAAFVLKGLDATVDEWQRSLAVNIIGAALCSKYAAQAMKKTGKGAIVNLGSISSFVAQPEFIAYSATKGAIVQMTRNMAMDLAPFNIRVNCVCPGTILTPASYSHMAQAGITLEQFLAEEGPKNLLDRVGEPREVAYAILFLASDEASFITGAHLMVDGGYTTK